MLKRRFEVHGIDKDGNVYHVASDRKDAAEGIAEMFRSDGFSEVELIENEVD